MQRMLAPYNDEFNDAGLDEAGRLIGYAKYIIIGTLLSFAYAVTLSYVVRLLLHAVGITG